MTKTDRLAVSVWAIKTIPPQTKAKGKLYSSDGLTPAHWEWMPNDMLIVLTEGVLLAPNDPELASTLDIWPESEKKVLSISWLPSKPWEPPQIRGFENGDWLRALGWPFSI